MRNMHGPDATFRVERKTKSDDLPPCPATLVGADAMFVRAVLRVKRLVDVKQTLREMEVLSPRNADLLGSAGPDFSKMTRGLFARLP